MARAATTIEGRRALAALLDGRPLAGSARGVDVAIFADGANVGGMVEAYRTGAVDGFTTNPTLMAKAGVTDYREFAQGALAEIPDLPVCFEVISDEFDEMGRQAREISSWGENVFVKIPITNTRGDSSLPLVRELTADGLKLNVTAGMTIEHVASVAEVVPADTPTIVSIFAGRVADTGRDPVPVMREAAKLCEEHGSLMLLWASPREVLNVYQAEACGCHIVTLTPPLLTKLPLRGKDLDEFSRETVQMFFDDAVRAGYRL